MHFYFKILLFFKHVDEAKRANQHANKRIIYWPPFWNKVYRPNNKETKLLRPQFSQARSNFIIIIRIFNQDNPSVQCTVISGVLHIELN